MGCMQHAHARAVCLHSRTHTTTLLRQPCKAASEESEAFREGGEEREGEKREREQEGHWIGREVASDRVSEREGGNK